MVINNTTKYDEIWNSVYSKLSFSPSCEYRGHSLNVALPFHINENYSAYFPSFYPDGDYYFFIEENFEFGHLGHPWRQEIWIFGRDLIKEIEQVYLELGLKKLN